MINVTSNGVTQKVRPNETIAPDGTYIFYIPNVCGTSAGAKYSFTSMVTYMEPGQTFGGPYYTSGTASGTVSSTIIPYWAVEHTNNSANNFGSAAIPINASTTSFTISLFAKIESNSPNNDFAFSLPLGCSQGLYYSNTVGISWTCTNKYGAQDCTDIVNAPAGMGYEYTSPYSWTFYTIIYNAGSKTFSVYVNDNQVSSVTLNSTTWLENQFPGGIAVFQSESSSYSLSEVSDIQVYNESLTPSQISEIYKNSTFQPIFGKNLIVWIPMNGTAKDYSGHNLGIGTNKVVFTTQHS